MTRPLVTALLLGCLALATRSPQRAASITMGEESTRVWAAAYGLSGDRLWARALCESGGDPSVANAGGSGAWGLFQFMPATYESLRAQENADPRLAPHLAAFDPEYRTMDADAGDAEAHLAAWAEYAGYGYLWQCAY